MFAPSTAGVGVQEGGGGVRTGWRKGGVRGEREVRGGEGIWLVYLQFRAFREELEGGFFDFLKLFFGQFSVKLSDNFLAICLSRFLPRFLTRFFARVLARVWGRGQTIHTVYSTTRPQAKTIIKQTNIKKHVKPLVPPEAPNRLKCLQIFDHVFVRFLTSFLARVLGREKQIKTVYSTTRPQAKTIKHLQKTLKHI